MITRDAVWASRSYVLMPGFMLENVTDGVTEVMRPAIWSTPAANRFGVEGMEFCSMSGSGTSIVPL